MGLSCSCDDFDKGDYDRWWDAPYTRAAPAGATCCECDAAIPEGSQVQAFDCWTVFEPDVPEPRSFEPLYRVTDSVLERHADQLAEEYELARERWEDETGWDWDTERHERIEGVDYRCERCADLAVALDGTKAEGGLGFCLIGPGQLIETHLEYVTDYVGGPPMTWARGKDGVFHPRRKTVWELRREALGRKRRQISYFFRYGWRYWLTQEVCKIRRALGYQYEYDMNTGSYVWRR